RTSMRRLFTRRLSFRRAAAAPIQLSRVGRQESFNFTLGPARWQNTCPSLGVADRCSRGEGANDMSTILLVVLILLLLGALPLWPYSSSWGYYPSGGLRLPVLIRIILAVSGRL